LQKQRNYLPEQQLLSHKKKGLMTKNKNHQFWLQQQQTEAEEIAIIKTDSSTYESFFYAQMLVKTNLNQRKGDFP